VVTDIEELPGPEEYYESIRHIPIKVHPNPVKDGRLTLEFENTQHHQNMQLRCYDSFGRQLHSQKIYKGQQQTKLDVSGWSAGMYVAVIYSNGGACGKVKFVVE
ncbi:MAG: T9SS type A sorting domain-containing protein, partial [Bacteroidales bacterium]|nr:T9SS type A sorting domain-containing protein [Bacteroidales bacterium]